MDKIDFSHLSFVTLALIYLAGLMTSLTPCIYPMIPIVVGYLGGQSGSLRQRFYSSLSYVAGLSLVYSVLGIVAALTGRVFGQMTANLYVYLAFGLLLLILSGSMMDWYVLPLPQFLQGKSSSNEKRRSLPQSFLVGVSSGLVASPCSAPVLASLLFYIASQRDFFRGAAMMLTFSLGMNTFLLIVGFSAGFIKNLPRSGLWMVWIKKGMALILLASGLYFIFRAGQIS